MTAQRPLIPALVFCALSCTASTGAAEAPAPNIWPTAAPIVEEVGAAAVCGNALLERGESCDTCSKDCEPTKCTPHNRYTFQVRVLPPLGAEPIAATLHVSYRTDRLSIPGTGQDKEVLARIDFGPDPGITAVNDQDYSLRLVRSQGKGLTNPYVSIQFDGCVDAPAAPSADDIVCVVEGCAGAGGVIEGCTCVVIPVPADQP